MRSANVNAATSPWPVTDRPRILREYLSAEQFASCCDQKWSTDKRSSAATDNRSFPRHGSLLYAKQDHTRMLFPWLARRRSRVVLVTGESDVPVESGTDTPPPQVSTWFATNADMEGVEALPLGLGNSYCPVTTKATALADAVGFPKTGLLYANFRVETNPSARRPLSEKFRSTDWAEGVTFAHSALNAEDYARSLAAHRFVLCPGGNGTDTHRMWEALYAGTVPVVQRHPALEPFRDLPILFVDDLLALDKSFLEQSYPGILQSRWNTDKMFLPYWRERFERARRGTGRRVGWKKFLQLRLRSGLPSR